MKVEILKQTGTWVDAYFVMRSTQDKDLKYDANKYPDLIMKRRMLYSRHSPMKVIRYLISCEVANKVQNHLIRHNTGVNWFVTTLRNDKTNSNDTEVNRLTMRKIVFEINAIELIHLIKTRTCLNAERETREFVIELKKQLQNFDNVWQNEKLFDNPCTDCREKVFSPCSKVKRLKNTEL